MRQRRGSLPLGVGWGSGPLLRDFEWDPRGGVRAVTGRGSDGEGIPAE